MKKLSLAILLCLFILGFIVGTIIGNSTKPKKEQSSQFKIVTSFYPIYVMTANITEGAQDIELVNMTETSVGCLHDYTLTTNDMKKIENANVFIENGLGLESFNDKIVSAYPNLTVIDSSLNISNTIEEEEDEINPHIWTSLENYMSQVQTITEQLKVINSENAQVYQNNSEKYLNGLQELKEQYDSLQNIKGKKAICLNEALAYLADEVELDAIVIETDHEESTLSAESLKNLIQTMKEEEIKIILVDKDDNLKNAQTLANETEAEIYQLDSGLVGELTTGAFIKAMQENLKVLQSL